MNAMMITAAAIAALVATTAAAQTAPVATRAPAPAANAAASVDMTLNFTGIETATGSIAVAVFDSEATFDRGGAPVRQMLVPVNGATAQTVISGLPVGRYAIKAFHDVDGNGQMATNPFGMPTEPFAFSNNAVGNMGPARWADANFEVTAATASVTITIR